MPAVYILAQELEAGEEGFGITHGFINGVNTSLFTAGDEVYVGSNGGFTNQRPTGSNLIQKLGTVVRIDANNGSGVIQIDSIVSVPNIQQGYAWVGDINGVAQPIPTSSFVVSIDTGSLLTTASFDNGTRDLTFAKGDSSTFSVNIPGGSIETGSFATTGSNTFIGNQNIIGELTSSVAKSNVILNPQTITENITIGPDNNAFIVGPVAIDGVITVEGDSELYIHTPPTFIDTGSFATTGSNTFQGTQTINGDIYVTGSSLILSGSNIELAASNTFIIRNINPTSTPIIFNSNLEFNGPVQFNTSIYNNPSFQSSATNIGLDNINDDYVITLNSGSETLLETTDLVGFGDSTREVRLVIKQPLDGIGSLRLNNSNGFTLAGPSGSIQPNFGLTVSQVTGSVDYIELQSSREYIIIKTNLYNLEQQS
jgi:hypothetical protein